MLKIYAGCILIIAALFGATEAAVAQTQTFEIYGSLATPRGATPCAFCQVELESMAGVSRRVLADGNGDFNFRNLRDDSYWIRVSVRGYEQAVELFRKASDNHRKNRNDDATRQFEEALR